MIFLIRPIFYNIYTEKRFYFPNFYYLYITIR